MNKILVTGACGQLGAELTEELRSMHGADAVVASDITDPGQISGTGIYEKIDVLDREYLARMVDRHRIGTIYHLAAMLSAKAEQNIKTAWKLNMDGLFNILNLARDKGVDKVFWPSSIAVFGPDAPTEMAPQNSPLNPSTVYGISKLAGEQWCAYYHRVFGVDVRSIRYPGLIGYKSLPGGGTTDYAVEIFHKALTGKSFTCFLKKSCTLPMMYMKDAVKASIELMHADSLKLSVRTSYNISSVSFAPTDISESIKKRIPGFDIIYKPDYRQTIADSWPDSIDDSAARADWGWKPQYNLEKIIDEMIDKLPDHWDETV